jgi:hypothetical protein
MLVVQVVQNLVVNLPMLLPQTVITLYFQLLPQLAVVAVAAVAVQGKLVKLVVLVAVPVVIIHQLMLVEAELPIKVMQVALVQVITAQAVVAVLLL